MLFRNSKTYLAVRSYYICEVAREFDMVTGTTGFTTGSFDVIGRWDNKVMI
jgi:hypothetical protein